MSRIKTIWQKILGSGNEDTGDIHAQIKADSWLRSYRRWRRWGLISIIAAVIWFLGQLGHKTHDHIAVVEVRGEITDQSPLRSVFENIQKSKAVKAVLLKVNSGGGSASESEWLYNQIKLLKSEKKIPVVALVDGMAASGALMTILPADHVVAYHTSVIGSVGALINVPDVSNLMKTVGVSITDISSGALKGQPNPFSPMDKQSFVMLQRHVLSIAAWFLDLVKVNRGLSDSQVDLLKSGRIFVASEALSLKLIDAIGHEQDVQAWLKNTLKKDLPQMNYASEDKKPFLKDFFRKVTQADSGQSPVALRWAH